MEQREGAGTDPDIQVSAVQQARRAEREQGLIRIVYVGLATVYVALAAARQWDPGAASVFPAILGCLGYALVWLACIWRWPDVRWRPALALLLDVLVVSFLVWRTDALSIVFVPLYLLVVAGSGLRYGTAYLYGALALALAGFAAAAAANPFWRSHRPVELGLAVIMAAVPPALALLLGRLRRSHDELSRLCQQMERLARHDPLTGLLNAQLLQEGLAQHVASAARHGRPLAVLFVDLDNFKVINDTRGHAAGDALLRQIAARMRLCVRCSDLVARVGGDEFVLVLTEMQTPENALFVAEKLVRVLSGEPFVLAEGAPITVTTSIGVAIYPEAGQVAERLLASADCAMYRAKRQGRNQWCRFSEGDAEIWEGARCAVGGPA